MSKPKEGVIMQSAIYTPPGPAGGSAGGTLSERAMLVSLTIRQWSASKTDRRVSADVAARNNSDASMGRYAKKLVAPSALEQIKKLAGEIYLEHRRRTLPWLDNGTRILSSAGYFGYTEYMREKLPDWDAAVDLFDVAYPGYYNDAQTLLNGLFDPSDYPSPGRVRGLFGIERKILPLPDAADFRISLGDAETDRIRAEIAATSSSALTAATADVYERIAGVARAMAEKLPAYTGGRDGSFRDSLVTNVRDLVDILPSLNIAGDSLIDDLTARLRDLGSTDADVLRSDEGTRLKVAEEADSILSAMAGFVA